MKIVDYKQNTGIDSPETSGAHEYDSVDLPTELDTWMTLLIEKTLEYGGDSIFNREGSSRNLIIIHADKSLVLHIAENEEVDATYFTLNYSEGKTDSQESWINTIKGRFVGDAKELIIEEIAIDFTTINEGIRYPHKGDYPHSDYMQKINVLEAIEALKIVVEKVVQNFDTDLGL